MRIAVVSDIHGNRTAFEAVLDDLRDTAPDLVLHGGDLADTGCAPVEIVDRIRDLGWQGVVGNTDEMLAIPSTFEDFAGQTPNLEPLWSAVREMAAATREALGEERLAWLRNLPRQQIENGVTLVHATPESCWRSPTPEATDAEIEGVYGALGRPVAVYGHVHRPFIRSLPALTVVNSGSVGLPYDGDTRASYLLLDDSTPTIRRVAYDVEREISALRSAGLPHHDWIARILRSARPQAL